MMTERELYDNLLIELNKEVAPAILLEEFNYIVNKSIIDYVNVRYQILDIQQQVTDDLRVLRSNVVLNPVRDTTTVGDRFSGNYVVNLPGDYMHVLNVLVDFTSASGRCDSIINLRKPAARLTSDMYAGILNNPFLKPSVKKPYYYLINISGDEIIDGNIGRMEIRFGEDDANHVPNEVYVDYLRIPRTVNLTQDQLDEIEDTTERLEFPDYVCNEILKKVTAYFMENMSDPRLQTHMPVNVAIPNAGQAQQ